MQCCFSLSALGWQARRTAFVSQQQDILEFRERHWVRSESANAKVYRRYCGKTAGFTFLPDVAASIARAPHHRHSVRCGVYNDLETGCHKEYAARLDTNRDEGWNLLSMPSDASGTALCASTSTHAMTLLRMSRRAYVSDASKSDSIQ